MREIFAFINKKEFWNMREYEFSQLHENVEFAVYCMLSFFVPFFLAGPQLLVGSIVNCALVLGALNLRGWKIMPIILLPSIGVLFAGIIFSELTSSLIYMMPFIWAGNAILVLAVKYLALRKNMNKVSALVLSSVMKAGLMFVSAFALSVYGFVPAALLGAMGILQLQTALIGGGAALLIHAGKKRFFF